MNDSDWLMDDYDRLLNDYDWLTDGHERMIMIASKGGYGLDRAARQRARGGLPDPHLERDRRAGLFVKVLD